MKDLRDLVGTQYPIIQGGMANIATHQLAAAVSNAGGLGLVGAGGWDVVLRIGLWGHRTDRR